jgi:hypothetical protein
MTFIQVRANSNADVNHEISGTDFINGPTEKQVPGNVIQIMIFIRQVFTVLKHSLICGYRRAYFQIRRNLWLYVD